VIDPKMSMADSVRINQPPEVEEREAELARRLLPQDSDQIDSSTVDSLKKQIASHDARIELALAKTEQFFAEGDDGEPFDWRMRVDFDAEGEEDGEGEGGAGTDVAMQDPQARVFATADWTRFIRDGTLPKSV
jgi:hypothetical protein